MNRLRYFAQHKVAFSFTALTMLSIAMAGLYVPAKASADVNDFTVTNFAADYYLSNKDPQGEMRIVERINVDFTDQNHGIERALPEKYSGKQLHLHINKVSSDSNAPAQYTSYESNGNTVLRIGDASRTVTGAQEYTVDYTVDNVIKFYDNAPELYWNVNGVGWQQGFDHVSATVHLPDGLQLSNAAGHQLACYSGSAGSKATVCSISSDSTTIKADTTQPLDLYSNLTMIAGFNEGYFRPEGLADKIADYWKPVATFLVLPLLVGGYGLNRWLKVGRDPKGKGTIVPEYDAPDKLGPVEVGALVDFTVDNRDITALIISMAIRKYLRIIETDKKKLLGGKDTTYELVLLNTDYTALNEDEQKLLSALFPSPSPGMHRAMADSGSSLYMASATIKSQAEERLTKAGYFKSNPLNAGGKMVWSVIALLLGGVLLGNFVSLSVIGGGALAVVLALFFIKIMPARTEKGVAALEHIQGLKLYIQTAEADRIKMLQAPKAAYAQNHDEPERTVDLFEKLLPYAMVLGVEKDWAKQFKNLYTQPPDWYAGNYTAFSAGYLVGSLNSGFSSAVQTSFSPPSSSGSSGFGGGGFSGGGGGGGGGGGW